MYVAKCWEDLRFAEKDKSELEIAGFLRNIFKYSAAIRNVQLWCVLITGLCDSFFSRRLNSINSTKSSSRTLDAKVYSQEGNSPDYFLRSSKCL